MYSKTRNTLTALFAASMFVASGWLFGRPVSAEPMQASTGLRLAVADNGTPALLAAHGLSAMHLRHASRMNLAMPYFSFSLQASQRRTD